ncbi:MFS transporter [Komagataeibacter rhaeticus]|uniref:MFS transporter n=1 Tax=Komagataeibacter rhaeticus TaxID=215221 RepID=UPI0004D5E138|nr:MFS transporter [Komagataeibacter rhaeticus]KDU94497.1 MFS transporter [Komagataeibacter rhaeticus AF1]KDU97639.1 MFS transporter [Komagataeibacter rhaeticus AF1]MBL7241012.1 MFS transporter [Komagataeibacter rhaeticus]
MTSETTECNLSTSERLPLAGLLALATSGFITILTEALPAGLLPQMGSSLNVSDAMVGQLVTLYAVGSLVAAIPLTSATQGWRRRRLLLLAIGGFAVVNTVTAVSTSYVLTLVARFLAGVSAGLLWALLAGYASRMVAPALQGRAIAVAMVGTPLALSFGIPLGTLLGTVVGWRYTFGIMTVLTVGLLGWVVAAVPDFPGQGQGRRLTLRHVFLMPGVRTILSVTLLFVLAHNILYTYIAPFLLQVGMGGRVDMVLLVFGLTALVGIWLIGARIDHWLRALVLASIALFVIAGCTLGFAGTSPIAIYIGAGLWGLAFGGAATLFQTASARAAGEGADIAQSMIVTVWNAAIAGGGIIGGLLLDHLGTTVIPWAATVLLLCALMIVVMASGSGFTRMPRNG